MSSTQPFRVIIAGGGIGGLALANILEQAGLDYVLLERREEFAPQVGASIGVFPNGARILDQIGVWETVLETMDAIVRGQGFNSKGGPISPPSNLNLLSKARTGYEIPWGDRQSLLQILYENIRDKTKLLGKKTVVDIENTLEGVTVVCADSSSYRGDVLVGADGVSSKTREKMWQLAERDHPDLVKADKNCLTADYSCLFGIAKGLDQDRIGAEPGDLDNAYDYDRVSATIWSKNGKAYYFVEEKLDQTYRLGNFPRYGAEDEKDFMRRNGDLFVRPGLTLAELWSKTVSHRLVPVEEGAFKLWTWGRITCVGDSIHKSAPNLGAGGSAAIESAAALANELKKLVDECDGTRPTDAEIRKALAAYHKSRELRADEMVKASLALVKMQTMSGPVERFFGKYLLRYFGDFLQESIHSMTIGATKIDFLPLPMESLVGSMPFNPAQGVGHQESKIKRALLALPLLALVFICFIVLDAQRAVPWALDQLESGKFPLQSGSIPIRRTFYHIKPVDETFSLLNMFFLPSLYGTDPVSRKQAISFLSDGFVMLSIWLLESARRANSLTIMSLPLFFTLGGQLFGMGVLSPLYCFFSYVWSPVENFRARDQRLTRMNYTIGVLPAVAIGYLLPAYAMYFNPNLAARQSWLFIWQFYPIYISIIHNTISRVFPNTTLDDAAFRPNRDLLIIRIYIGIGILLSASTWLWTWISGPYGLADIYIPALLPKNTNDLTTFVREFLRFDELFSYGSMVLWLAYLFWDLKHAGMMKAGWLSIVGGAAVSLVGLGPGATVALGWLWRENILATRWHKDALTDKSVEKLHGHLN